jgi:hypothetical protein
MFNTSGTEHTAQPQPFAKQHYQPKSDAGISLTVAINIGIGFMLLIILLSCHGISLYSVKKKKKLVTQVHSPQEQINETPDHNQTISAKFLQFIHKVLFFVWNNIKALVTPLHFRRDAEQTTKQYGRDIATYFLFQKLCIFTFSVLFFVSCAVLLPIHLNGAAKGLYITANVSHKSAADEIHEDYNLMLTSINMVMQSPTFTIAHIVLAPFFAIVVVSILVYLFLRQPVVQQFNFAGCDEDVGIDKIDMIKAGRNQIRTFDRKYQMVLNSNTTEGKHNATLVSPYTVVIHGFPRALRYEFQLKEMILHLVQYPAEIVKISLVLDLSHRINLQKKLEKTESRLEHFKYAMEQRQEQDQDESSLLAKPVRPRVLINKPASDGNMYPVSVDAIEHFENKKSDTLERIQRWDNSLRVHLARNATHEGTCDKEKLQGLLDYNSKRYKIMGSGYGFIVFSKVDAAKRKWTAVLGLSLIRVLFTVPKIWYGITD